LIPCPIDSLLESDANTDEATHLIRIDATDNHSNVPMQMIPQRHRHRGGLRVFSIRSHPIMIIVVSLG
jgi:hypothetical protein